MRITIHIIGGQINKSLNSGDDSVCKVFVTKAQCQEFASSKPNVKARRGTGLL